MANLNRIVLIGRLTDNPEILNTTEGNALAKFTLAVDRPARPDGVKETDFINIVAWSKLAERCAEFLSKGRLVLIEGRIQNRNFTGADGQKKYVVEIVASQMKILDAKKSTGKDGEISAEMPADLAFAEGPGGKGEFTFEEADAEALESSEVPF
jgi:single-strand DNA-binding protein